MHGRTIVWLFLALAFSTSSASAATTTLIRHDYEHDARGCQFQMCVVDAGQYAGI